MKTLLLTIIMAATGAFASVVAAPPRLVFVLTDRVDKKGGGEIAGVVSTLINRAPVETQFTFVSGGAQPKTFLDFTKTTYPSRKAEGRAMNTVKNALWRYYALAAQNGKDASIYGGIHIPEVIKFLPSVTKSENTRVVFLGSILFQHDPGNSFVDTSKKDVKERYRRPSYAHLSDAERFQSAFAIPDDKPDLKGVTIQFFDPYEEEFPGSSGYFAEVEEFQAAFLAEFNVRLAKVHSDRMTFVREVMEKPVSFVKVSPRPDEKTITMLTIADLLEEIAIKERKKAAELAKQEAERREAIAAVEQAKADAKEQAERELLHERKMAALRREEEEARRKGAAEVARINAERSAEQAKKLAEYEKSMAGPKEKRFASHLLISDHSNSMEKYHDRAARAMTKIKFAPGERGVLILYSDHDAAEKEDRVAFVFSESSKSEDLAAGFREAPLRGGGDIPEALHMGLAEAWKTLQERPKGKVKISIFTDAPAKDVGQHPSDQKGYRELIGMLQEAGHEITLYRCGDMPTTWLPKGVTVKDL